MALPDNAKNVFKGILFDVYQWDQEMFDSSKEIFEAIKRVSTVQTIVVKGDKIILLQEEQPFEGKYIGLSGGQMDEGETPEQSALRELKEETGLIPEKIEFWRKKSFTKNIIWDSYYFIAKNCKNESEPNLDVGEKINPYEITFEQLFEETEKPEFKNETFSNWLFRIKHNKKDKEEFKKLLFS